MGPSLSNSDELFLKSMYRRLHEEPLEASNPEDCALYEPVYQCLAEADDPEADPVYHLERHIKFKDVESIQFFSGFKGSGKTTELLRLKQRLSQADYIVLYANALDYINPSGILDITDLLLSIASALGDKLSDPAVLGRNLQLPSFGDRMESFFKSIKVEPGLNLPLNWLSLKVEMKDSPSFRQRLQTALASHINVLKEEVNRFVQDCVKAVDQHQQAMGAGNRSIVFLFDSLEQIRGGTSTESLVQESVEKVFTNHLSKLKFPYLHMVYTVPPWLKFVASTVGSMVVLPSVRQWGPDAVRSPYQPGQNALRRVLLRRFGEDGCKRLFGPSYQSAMQPLIDQCGGHFRDLLRLAGQAMLATRVLPIPARVIEHAIQKVRSDFLPILVSDAQWLKRISDTRAADPRSTEDRIRLIRFLDGHMVLYLRNGQEWYDVHPLIREEVAAIVKRNPA